MTTSFTSRLGTAPEEGIKAPCVASTTADITLSGEQTIDGVAVVAGDRVLVRSQTDTTENGIYDASTSAWTRSTDFNDPSDLINGNLVPDANSDIVYQVEFTGSYSPETTAITFAESISNALVTKTGAAGIQSEYNERGQYHVDLMDDLIGVDLTSFPAGETVICNAINAGNPETYSTWKKISDGQAPPDAVSGVNTDGCWYSAASSATKFQQVRQGTGFVKATKSEAVKIAPFVGKTMFIEGADGGLFKAVTGAAPATYSDNGGSYCGTVFIPTGGDGSTAWIRDYRGGINVNWFGASESESAANNLTSFQTGIDSTTDGQESDIYVTGNGDFDIVCSSLTYGTRRINWYLDIDVTVGGDLIQSRVDADLLPGTTTWGGRVWRSSESESSVPMQVIKHNNPLNFFATEAAFVVQQKNDDTLGSGGAVDGEVHAFASDGNGAVNGVLGADGNMTAASTTLTSAAGPFVVGDVGKFITVFEANTSGHSLFTSIATYVSANEVTTTLPCVQTAVDVDFIISASTDSFWRGMRTQIDKTGGGTGHCHTINGNLGITTTYNELGGYQGFIRNVASENGYVSGIEMRVADSPDDTAGNALDTRMIGCYAGIGKMNPSSVHISHAFDAGSFGLEDVDTAYKAEGLFRDGINFKDSPMSRWSMVCRANGQIGWVRNSDSSETLTECNRLKQTVDAVELIFGGTGSTYSFGILDSLSNVLFKVDNVGIATVNQLVIKTPTVPSSSTSVGVAGMISWDASYIYVCIASGNWARAAIGGAW